MVVIIDYGAGNIRSVINAVTFLGYQPEVTNRPEDVLKARAVILPGVGAAGDTMTNLRKYKLDEAVGQYIQEGRPFLGICLGLQILLTRTEEDDRPDCLNIYPGQVRKLPAGLKIPHMGWNQVKLKQPHPVFGGIPDNSNFYFVHSYYAAPDDKSLVTGETEYGTTFCSMLTTGNLVAVQFHPEKSGDYGLKFFDNFLKLALVK
ncbi:MAG: imidazole glycerol phosphate synthase subunit HisH [Dehalococcoidales bacterium]|nr:imidazole glycerol phosphate synthase subunit HisH [Dehalococcoidales bacterium]